MDIERRTNDGGWHFRLGAVERWIVGIAATAVTAGGVWMVSSVQTLVTQQAVANSKLSDLTTQLGDMPAIRRDTIELKVRVDQHEAAIKEIRQTRGAR